MACPGPGKPPPGLSPLPSARWRKISALTSSRHCLRRTSSSVRCCNISACCCFRPRLVLRSCSTIRFSLVIASLYVTSRSYCLLWVCCRRACSNCLCVKFFLFATASVSAAALSRPRARSVVLSSLTCAFKRATSFLAITSSFKSACRSSSRVRSFSCRREFSCNNCWFFLSKVCANSCASCNSPTTRLCLACNSEECSPRRLRCASCSLDTSCSRFRKARIKSFSWSWRILAVLFWMQSRLVTTDLCMFRTMSIFAWWSSISGPSF
mmetsp:Transcript_116381/g.325529  ORF Transcript_116381/g.325529 Transcript_116381/m.325529 type:complete len:267 (+) Transcript_116381:476-1276(+)